MSVNRRVDEAGVLRVTVEGVNKVDTLFSEVPFQVMSQLVRFYQTKAIEMMNYARRIIQKPPKSGRMYWSAGMGMPLEEYVGQKGGLKHQASAPGQPPATYTGFLANSIKFKSLPYGAEIATNIEYAAALEFGNKRQHLMARPYMKRTADKYKEEIANKTIEIINQITGGK